LSLPGLQYYLWDSQVIGIMSLNKALPEPVVKNKKEYLTMGSMELQ